MCKFASRVPKLLPGALPPKSNKKEGHRTERNKICHFRDSYIADDAVAIILMSCRRGNDSSRDNASHWINEDILGS